MKSKGQGIKIVSSSHIIAKQRKIFLCFPNSNHIIVMPPNIKYKYWNNLNNDIKVCIDVNSFRSKLRGVLLDKFKREE